MIRRVPSALPALALSLLGALIALGAGCAPTSRDLDLSANRAMLERRDGSYVERHYEKREVKIPMRDGVLLHTTIYSPCDRSVEYPIMMRRTPYSCSPYGEDQYARRVGPSLEMMEDGYIFVYQDVRGKFMSEGDFENMRPHNPDKQSPSDIDEASDTYDTIGWLVQNVENNNGRVGMWGISYPGFYTAAGMIDAHPNLVAVSPQAPIADWWFDDFKHHGTFFMPHAFNFMARFGQPRPEPTTEWLPRFEHGTPDGYAFFKRLGPAKNLNDWYLFGDVEWWNEFERHPDYDEWWQARSIVPHLRNVPPAVMTVGGWFDAEDLYGPLSIYQSTEQKNPDAFNILVMGPWVHGGWARGDGSQVGNIYFGEGISEHYRKEIEAPFFNHYLKDGPAPRLAEAIVYETGENRWRRFDEWPPAEVEPMDFYLHDDGFISDAPPSADPADPNDASDAWVSHPDKPVPYTETITTGMTRAYMTDDQRFAARRPDVLVYQTDVLEEDVTLAGPLLADIWVATSGTASDFVVKVIDVFPHDAEDYENMVPRQNLGGYQMMVRSEVIRGRYRNSYEHPEPFTPNEPARIQLPLQDVMHTFRKGHRIMIQIQSTWFPLVDINPHTYVDNVIFAEEEDFVPATNRVFRTADMPSRLRAGVLGEPILETSPPERLGEPMRETIEEWEKEKEEEEEAEQAA